MSTFRPCESPGNSGETFDSSFFSSVLPASSTVGASGFVAVPAGSAGAAEGAEALEMSMDGGTGVCWAANNEVMELRSRASVLTCGTLGTDRSGTYGADEVSTGDGSSVDSAIWAKAASEESAAGSAGF